MVNDVKKIRKDKKGRILEKGETYQERFDRYRYTYKDISGRRRSVFASSLKELRDREHEIKKRYYLGLNLSDPYITLNEIFDICMISKQNLKENSRYRYNCAYNKCVRDSIGTRPICKFRFDDIQMFYAMLLDSGRSYNYIQSVHMLLRMCFKRALLNDYIYKDPTDGALAEFGNNFDVDKSYHRKPALTLEQTRIFLKALRDRHEVKWKNMFIVLFGTGLRIGELLGLNWKNINFDEGYIVVDHQLQYLYDGNSYSLRINTPKTDAGVRLVPMIDEVREALISEKKENDRLHIRCKLNIDGYNDFIFLNGNGTIRGIHQINQRIKKTVDNYNVSEIKFARDEGREPILLPHFTAHTSRHTFCSRLCESDVQATITQKIMGHTSITTTMNIYAEISEDVKKIKLQNINGRIV